MKSTSSVQFPLKPLRLALVGLAKVVARRPSLPVLGCVRIDPRPGKVILTGTDLDTFLDLDLPAEVEDPGDPFLVPLAELQEVIKNGGTQDQVILVPESDDRVSVTHCAGTTRIPHVLTRIPLSEFPEMPTVKEKSFDLNAQDRESLLQAMACSSSDPTRLILNGACLDHGHTFVGTDGRHLYRSNSMKLPVKGTVVIPSRKILDWKTLLDSPVWHLAVGDEWFRLSGDHWTVTSRHLEGNYPNWKQVLPPDRDFKSSVTFREDHLETVVGMIRTLPGEKLANKPVGLKLSPQGVSLLARSGEDARMVEVPVAEAQTSGSEVTVFVNRDYLTKALGFGFSRVEFIDALSPVRLRGVGANERDMIVMPLRAPYTESDPTPSSSTPTQPEPMKTQPQPAAMTRSQETPADQGADSSALDVAASQITNLRELLRQAASGLGELVGTLKQARTEQKSTEREIRHIRGTIRSLQKMEL